MGQPCPDKPGTKLKDLYEEVVNKIRENIVVARILKLNGPVAAYTHHDGTLGVLFQAEGTGKNETLVEATVDGIPLLIAFNVKYLREVLEVIKTPNVAIETSAPNAPGVIRPVGDEDFLHVIMPMHLG